MQQTHGVSKKRSIIIYLLVAFFLFYEMGIQVSPGIITKQLMLDFNTNAVGLGLMSGFFYYTYTVMQIPAGLLYDRFNVRFILTVPVILCALGALFFSVADSIFLGSVGRLLMGIGAAFAFIGVLVVVSDLFSVKYFPFFVGLTQLLAAIGAMSGGLPLIPFIEQYGWRSTISSIAFIGFILAGLIWIMAHYNRRLEQQEKKPSIVHSLKVISMNPQTWIVAVYACVLWAPMSTFAALWGIPFLEKVYHLSETQAAFINALMWIGLACGSPLLGWWSSHIQRRRMPLVVAALIGWAAFSTIMFAPNLSMVILGLLVFIAGAACSGQALSFAVIKDINSKETMAAAIGFNNMAVVIAGAIFQPLVGKMIQHHSSGEIVNNLPFYTGSDFQYGMVMVALCYGIGLLVSLCFIRESGTNETTELDVAQACGVD